MPYQCNDQCLVIRRVTGLFRIILMIHISIMTPLIMRSLNCLIILVLCFIQTIRTSHNNTVDEIDNIFKEISQKTGPGVTQDVQSDTRKYSNNLNNLFDIRNNGFGELHFQDGTRCSSMYSPPQIEELPEGDSTSFTLDLQCPSQEYTVSKFFPDTAINI